MTGISERVDMRVATDQSLRGHFAFDGKIDIVRATLADQYIFREHDPEKYLCVIAEGRVDILKDSGEQTSEVLARFKSGHVFGEMALIDGQPRSASAVARKSTLLFILSQERFQALIDEEPHTAIAIILKFSEVMIMRLRLTSGQLVKQRAEDR